MNKPKGSQLLPRDAAGTFELKEGTGEITGMVSCGEFLEIYKVDKTFRVKTPESVDPERINPNAPWVVSPVSDVGSGNPIVARLFIQSAEMLKNGIFNDVDDVEQITQHLHKCKESLISCETVANKISKGIDDWVEKIDKSGISSDNLGRAFNPFPVVEDLESDCSDFFVKANRYIKQICEIPFLLLNLSRKDNNFDFLEKRLIEKLGPDVPFVEFVRENRGSLKYIIELRNYDEHPGEKQTLIENFHVSPDGMIEVPCFSLKGGEDDTKYSIKEAVMTLVGYLLNVGEAVVIHSIVDGFSNEFPFIVEAIPDEMIDVSKPIRYRLGIDTSKLKFGNGQNEA